MAQENIVATIGGLTGLPTELMQKELLSLIKKAGFSSSDITLDELRPILVSYLQDTILEAKKNY